MADFVDEANASDSSRTGSQKKVSDPCVSQQYMHAFELRMMTRMEELFKEQSTELMEVINMSRNANRFNRISSFSDLGQSRISRVSDIPTPMPICVSDLTTAIDTFETEKSYTFQGAIRAEPSISEDSDSDQSVSPAMHILFPAGITSLAQRFFSHSQGTSEILTKQMQGSTCFQQALQSHQFRLLVMSLILIQSIVIGWESHTTLLLEKERLKGSASNTVLPKYFIVLDHAFATIFLLELLARIAAWKLKFFDRNDVEWFSWNMFDTFLVLCSFLVFLEMRSSWLRSIRLFRMARLLRILRSAKKLRRMAYAFARSLESILWLMVLLFVMLYIFSLAVMRASFSYMRGVESAQYQELDSGDPVFRQDLLIILNKFDSLQSTMLSLLATFTGGAEWDSLFKPIMSLGPVYYITMVAFVILFVFAIMNVVTGVFVEDAMKIASIDESVAISDLIESESQFDEAVERLMSTIDQDNDGLVNCEQILEAFKKEHVQQWLAVRDIDLSVENARRILTFEGSSGYLDAKALKGFLRNVQGQARRTDLIVVASDLRRGQNKLRKAVAHDLKAGQKRLLLGVQECCTRMAEMEGRLQTFIGDNKRRHQQL